MCISHFLSNKHILKTGLNCNQSNLLHFPGQTELERCYLQQDLGCICVLGICCVILSHRLTIQGSVGMTKGITQQKLSVMGLSVKVEEDCDALI